MERRASIDNGNRAKRDRGSRPRRPSTHQHREEDDHAHVQHDHTGARSGQRKSKEYSTEAGISQEKLRELNGQLGWSSEDTSESNDLYVEKRRHRRDSRHAGNHGVTQLRKRSDEEKTKKSRNSASPQTLRRNSRHRRNITDDFYYREKPDHQRVTSGVPLVAPHSAGRHNSHHQHHKEHRRRSRDIEKASALRKRKRRKWITAAVCVILLLALITGLPVGLAVHQRHADHGLVAANASLTAISPDSIPAEAKGTYLDPFTWYDTVDFNLTFTSATVGGLSIMGLNDAFDNTARANPSVPDLSEPWLYGTRPVRGINIGGWLSLEPFITPSLFNTTLPAGSNTAIEPPYPDEWALSAALGPEAANALLDQHYSQFANRSTFEQIRAAGFDHVRIPFPYWAVKTYPGDAYIAHTCWRYLLRGIEYARQNGLRLNLDLHSAPGSQNGWNHSGRQGSIGWLNGTEGQLNADRTLQIHQQLSAFFAQERYKGLVTMYGILNEPRMIFLDQDTVLNWTATAIRQVRASPLPNDTVLVFSDGFQPLPYWQSAFGKYPDIIPPGSNAAEQQLLLDSHEYVIFNRDQLMLNHTAKLDFACNGWSQQVQQSMNPKTGFGSFICGEWSQADTDCASHLNPEGTGNRWEGSLRTGNATTSVNVPSCPLLNDGQGNQCSCDQANADPKDYSQGYKQWLSRFADAQIQSFSQGWGSFYWTWDVEDGVPGGAQWSWKKGVEADMLPKNIADRKTELWRCSDGDVNDWGRMGLPETY